MQLSSFATHHRLRTRRDECGETIIPGKLGQVYRHGGGKLGVIFMPDPKGERAPRSRLWTNVKRKLEAAGFTIHQDCDGEGSALFDPANQEQAGLAIRVIRARPRRVMSEAQRVALNKAREASGLIRPRAPGPLPALETIPADVLA